jgi:hypothetical protein
MAGFAAGDLTAPGACVIEDLAGTMGLGATAGFGASGLTAAGFGAAAP